jgi:hypothetical protein
VSLRSRHPQLGIEVPGQAEAGAERHAGPAFHRIGIGVHDFGRDAVVVQRLIPLDGVPAASELLVVLFKPLPRELVVTDAEVRRGLDERCSLAQELIELGVETAFEVVPILCGRQPGVPSAAMIRYGSLSAMVPPCSVQLWQIVMVLQSRGQAPR